MNRGLSIFNRVQRLQRGTEYLEPGPLPPEKRQVGPKEAAGLYDPGPLSDEDYNQAYEEYEMSLDLADAGLTQDELDFARAHPPEEWPQSLRDKLLDTTGADESDIQEHAKGTSDVLHLAGGSGFVPSQWTYYNPGGGGREGGLYGNRDNLLNPYRGTAGTQDHPISIAYGPGNEGLHGQLVNLGRFGWGRYEDFGPGVGKTGDIAVGGRYKSLARTGWNPRLFRGGGGGGGGGGGAGGGGNIPGGPFRGWTPEQMQQWHSGTPPSQMGYPSFTGTTAGPGGTPLTYETTSYNIPGYGWVPRAQLANAQASTNPLDYLNPFGGTSKGGPGTGDPTQRGVGMAVGTLSNVIVPGLGFLTGPLARYVTKLIQGGASPQQVKQVVKEQQQAAGIPKGGAWQAPSGGGGYAQGAGVDPYGNPTTGRQWYSSDFGRGFGPGAGGYNLAGPGGGFGTRGLGFSGHTVQNFGTAIGFGGNLGGSAVVGAGRYMGNAGLNKPFSAERYAQLGNNLSNKGYGTWNNQAVTMPNYQQYLSMWNPTGGGQQEFLGKGTPKKAQFAQGDEDVMSLHRGNYPVSEEELATLPEWLAKMLRNIPLKPPGGNEREQFRPRDVPVFQGPRGKFYDPSYSREDKRIMAAEGTSDVNPGLRYFHQKVRKKKPKL